MIQFWGLKALYSRAAALKEPGPDILCFCCHITPELLFYVLSGAWVLFTASTCKTLTFWCLCFLLSWRAQSNTSTSRSATMPKSKFPPGFCLFLLSPADTAWQWHFMLKCEWPTLKTLYRRLEKSCFQKSFAMSLQCQAFSSQTHCMTRKKLCQVLLRQLASYILKTFSFTKVLSLVDLSTNCLLKLGHNFAFVI